MDLLRKRNSSAIFGEKRHDFGSQPKRMRSEVVQPAAEGFQEEAEMSAHKSFQSHLNIDGNNAPVEA